MSERVLAAVDLGAESGRVIVGRLDGSTVSLEVVHRFSNEPVRLHDGLHWNMPGIFAEILAGLAQAGHAGGRLDGIGIDAWGVDYALLDDRRRMLGLPFHYRDERVAPATLARAHERVSREELYARVGIQTMQINTIYQLLSEADGAAAAVAQRIALVPDLLCLWLTGELANEATIASTSGLLDARTGGWARDLIARLGLPAAPFAGDVVEPGTRLGPALGCHSDALRGAASTPVWTVAGHDTASAFVATPLRDETAAVLSSGTWSLVGLEVDQPCLGTEASAFNLTNERGLGGTIRLLRNVMGLWLLQECRREWAAAGDWFDYKDLLRLAAAAPAQVPLFDPDDESLLRRGDMPGRIAALCAAGGQQPPAIPGELVRSILTSLACKYRFVIERLEQVTGRRVGVLNVVGGGTRNTLLCQLTADLLGLPVLAGPEEATALGNILVQARALGDVGSLAEMRELVAGSVEITRYEPTSNCRSDDIYERFLTATKLEAPRASSASNRREWKEMV
jgi:rhamnulokinase